jgi:hypothetical protein
MEQADWKGLQQIGGMLTPQPAVTVRVFVTLDIYFVSVKYVFVSVKLMCDSKKGIFVITEKPRVVFVKCIWIK